MAHGWRASFRVLGRSSGWSRMCDPQLQRSHVCRHAIKLALTNRCIVILTSTLHVIECNNIWMIKWKTWKCIVIHTPRKLYFLQTTIKSIARDWIQLYLKLEWSWEKNLQMKSTKKTSSGQVDIPGAGKTWNSSGETTRARDGSTQSLKRITGVLWISRHPFFFFILLFLSWTQFFHTTTALQASSQQ